MKYALIIDGVVGIPHPQNEADPEAVAIPDCVKLGDTTEDGVTFYRNGVLVPDPGYQIPVADLFRELTDAELATVLAIPFPRLSSSQMGVLVFMLRALAQTELSSLDPRVIGARQQFAAVLGADRISHLFRPR